MIAGRELDALVAEKVMGLDLLEEDNYENWIPVEPEPYSTDIAAAWELVNHFTKMGWDISVVSSGEMRMDDSWPR